ncbi:unnamed protein product [Sphenostylis stenocarpa]|uniref:Uncharacterized protein n=1 Tax=Sphenostylis stenocarpa TaxID=92480 RepID=A0AA86SR21_9FABA|nr:unnamed protein product [Sphenostylis stenocarpa]
MALTDVFRPAWAMEIVSGLFPHQSLPINVASKMLYSSRIYPPENKEKGKIKPSGQKVVVKPLNCFVLETSQINYTPIP